MSVTITLNGKPNKEVSAATILTLLDTRGIDPAHVVVEVNSTIIDKQDFSSCKLSDGDIVEILRFVGGG